MKKTNYELIRKNKKLTAIAITAISLILVTVILLVTLLSANKTVTHNGDLMADIGSDRSSGTDIDDEFKTNYSKFCLNLLDDIAFTEYNVGVSLTSVMSSVALLGASSDSNAYYEVKKVLGMEPLEIGKKLSSIESRTFYSKENGHGFRGANAMFLNGSAMYGVKSKFLKNNKKYFGLMIDRELFDDKNAVNRVMEKYKVATSYSATTDYEPKVDEYMDIYTISDFVAEWETCVKTDFNDVAQFEGIRSNFSVPYITMVSNSAFSGNTYVGITEKLKGGYTFVGLCPKTNEENDYYSTVEIIGELKSTGKFKNMLSDAKKLKVGVKIPCYTNASASNPSISLVSTLKKMNIESLFKEDAGLNGITDDYKALHLDEFRVSGDVTFSHAGITNDLSKNPKDFSEEYEKCQDKLTFDHSFPYFIIDNETNLPIYFGIFNNID